MPVARFQMPDGRIGRFEVPDGTTPEQAHSLIQAHVSGGNSPQAPAQDDVADEFSRGAAHTLIPGAESAPTPQRRPSAIAGIPGAITTMARGIPGMLAGGATAAVRELASRALGADPQQARLEGQEAGSAVSAPIIGEPSAQAQSALEIAGKLFDESKLAGLNPAGPVSGMQNPGLGAARDLTKHRAMAPAISVADAIASASEAARATKAAEAAPKVEILNRAREAGLKLLPTQTNPTRKNRLLEGLAGKTATAQEISETNAPIVNKGLQKHFGVDEPLVPRAINEETGKVEGPLLDVRKREVDEGYKPVKATGQFGFDEALESDLNALSSTNQSASRGFPNATVAKDDVSGIVEGLKQPTYDASSTIDMIQLLRKKSRLAFRTGDESLGETYVGAANALESRVERHLQEIQQPELLDRFRRARTTIAQTHDVEPALTPSGDVNAQALGARSKSTRKAPLTGPLKTVADFAREQPKAVQPASRIGGVPAASPIDTGIALATSSPGKFATAMAAIPGRPMLRQYLQSEGYQAKNVVPNDFSQPGLVERLARHFAGEKDLPAPIRPDPNAIPFTGADIPSMIAERLRIGERAGPAGNEIDFGARERALAPASRVEAAESEHAARQADAARAVQYERTPVGSASADRLGLAESPPKRFGNEIDPSDFLRALRLGMGEAVDEAVVDRAFQAEAAKKRFPPSSVMKDFQWLMKDK